MSSATLANPFVATASSGGGGSYDLCPAGSHPAHLIAIIDLGTFDDEYQGTAKLDVRKICFAWELPGEIKPDGSPFVLIKDYTVSVNADGGFALGDKSNLRLMLENWRGKKYQPSEPIDIGACLGKPCLVNVQHTTRKDKEYHNIAAISALPKGMAAPARSRDTVMYHTSMGSPPKLDWMPYLYGGSPKSMQPIEDIISQSKERKGLPIGNGKPATTPYSEPIPPATPPAVPGGAGIDDDDIPF